MHDVSQLVSEDSRTPMQRLRRAQLWKVADAIGLSYPNGAPKTVMIALLEANSVDVTQPVAGIQWKMMQGRTSDGMPTQQLYPVIPVHASERKGVNAEAVMAQKMAEKTAREEEAFKKKRLEVLERDNERLKALEAENAKLNEANARLNEIINERLAALEGKAALVTADSPQKDYWSTYRKAKEMGLEVKRSMKLEQLEKLIRESEHENTS